MKNYKEYYDVIIIGGGIGGLTAANVLAYHGIEALLIEQHSQVGGYFQGFTRKGFYFDSGIQACGIKGVIQPLLQRIMIDDKVQFVRSDFRIVVQRELDVILNTIKDIEEPLCHAFPESINEIKEYFNFYQQVIDDYRNYNENGLPQLMSMDCSKILPDFKHYWMQFPHFENIQDYMFTRTNTKDKTFVNQPNLAYFLRMGYPNTSIFHSALFWYSMLEDYFYPIGGFQSFVNLLEETFLNRGGTIVKNTLVESILTERNTIVGVRTSKGKELRCTYVISNADYKKTIGSLVKGATLDSNYTQKLTKARVSLSFVTLYLGLDIDPQTLRKYLQTHHVFFYPAYQFKFPRDPQDLHKHLPLTMASPSIIDHRLAPEGKSTLVLQTFSPYRWMKRWKIGQNGKKGEEYKTLKNYVAHQLITNAENIIPDLSKRILWKEIATPLTHERYTLNSKGATAGWTWDPNASFISPMSDGVTTPITNLYCASHWALTPGGSTTSALAGKIAADLIISGDKL